jgi:hypothetical protein
MPWRGLLAVTLFRLHNIIIYIGKARGVNVCDTQIHDTYRTLHRTMDFDIKARLRIGRVKYIFLKYMIIMYFVSVR